MKRNWYRMNLKAGGTSAEIAIYDEIGFWGITAKDFRNDLKALGEVEEIELRINSPGGEVMDALAIFNLLLDHPARVMAYIDGWAASAASLIAMTGDEVLIAENAYLMIHNPWGGGPMEADEHRKYADLLDSHKTLCIGIYQRHADLSDDELNRMMDEGTWLTGQEAVDAGFATGTFAAVAAAASAHFDPQRYAETLHAPPAARRIFQTSPAEPEKETAMSRPNRPNTDPKQPSKENPPATDPSTQPDAGADSASLAAERQQLADERKAIREERLAARRERFAAAVDRELEDLGSRLTPAMRRAGTRSPAALAEALLALRMADDAPEVEVEVEDGDQVTKTSLSAYDVVLAALRNAPSFEALGAGDLATSDGDAPPAVDRRTAEQRAYDRKRGISDEDAIKIQKAHPGAFGAN